MNSRLKNGIIIGLASIAVLLVIFWSIGLFNGKNPLDSSTEGIQLSLEIQDLKGTELIEDSAELNKYELNNQSVVQLLTNNYTAHNSKDSSILETWKTFFDQEYVKETEIEILNVFPNYDQESKELIAVFKRLKFHFPKKKYPNKIIFTNTNFGGNVYLEEGTILVGTERYIGGHKKVIQNSLPPDAFPQWLKNGFEKKYLTRDIAMSTLIFNNTIPDSKTEYLIDKIIEWGKICVLTEMALRLNNNDIKPEIILRWNHSQFKWAEQNEKAFWAYLKKNQFLFKSNEKTNAFLLNNGPYTIGFSEKSPDRLGQYLGWKMVRNYIFEEGISLREMVKLDYKEYLKKYNP